MGARVTQAHANAPTPERLFEGVDTHGLALIDEWITEMSGRRSYLLFLRDPLLDSLRGEPEFIQLMAELKREWERRLQEYQ